MRKIPILLAFCLTLAFGHPLRAQQTNSEPDQTTASTEVTSSPIIQQEGGLVYIIPIHNMIEPALLYVIRRGVTEADKNNADMVVFTMDTPGGTLDAAGEILQIIQNITVPTCTFVEKDAYSAGAIIALATDKIYMAPGSVIGDAMPIMVSSFSGVQEMPEDIQEKMVSGVSAKIRAAAEHGGHDKELAEAMVRRQNEYKIGEEVICPEGELLTLTSEEAVQTYGENNTPLLSAGIVDSVDDILRLNGLQHAKQIVLEVTTAEKIARFIAKLAPVFLMLGLLGIYIEIKTPGFGLPGILGAVCLLTFFWGHHIAGLAGMEDLVIFALGVALLLVEIFVIPGFGFVGAFGILLITLSLISAMVEHYPGTPWYRPEIGDISHAVVLFSTTLIGTFILGWATAKVLPKTKLFGGLILQKAATPSEGFNASTPLENMIGQTGIALCELRPAGTARFNGQKLSVVTRGSFIEADQQIQVVELHGNRIIVEKFNADK